MPKIILVSKWVMPFGYGIYLPFNTILVRRDSNNVNYVIAHEECHYRQSKKHCCYFSWFINILGQYIKYGYHNSPYEVEAREYGSFIARSKEREHSSI